jgi:hypothetical protein
VSESARGRPEDAWELPVCSLEMSVDFPLAEILDKYLITIREERPETTPNQGVSERPD